MRKYFLNNREFYLQSDNLSGIISDRLSYYLWRTGEKYLTFHLGVGVA